MTNIICEIGVNHGGSLTAALQLADAAKAVGADIAKYQLAIPELEATGTAPVAPYQAAQDFTSQRAMIRDLMLTRDEFDKVIAHCDNIGIEFMASAGDCDSLRWLIDGRINTIKIGSGDLTNGEMLQVAGETLMPVILSTGMATPSDIHAALAFLPQHRVTLLQCTSAYPCPIEDVNLAAIASLRQEFKLPVGFSDHTSGIAAAIGAAAMGAVVIEKHMTLNRLSAGPDHAASLEPFQFKRMVDLIREVEKSLGSPRKMLAASEIENAASCHKRLVASRPIVTGECFTPENITAKRAAGGRPAIQYHFTLGSTATRDYAVDEGIA